LQIGRICHATNGCVYPPSDAYEAVIDVYIPNEKPTYYRGEKIEVRVKAFLREKSTGNIVYRCDSNRIQNNVCKINSIIIDTSIGVRNYMQETNWNHMHSNNYDMQINEWKFTIDTNVYHTTMNVSGDVGGLGGSDEEEFVIQEATELKITVNYPDVDNYLVPKTPTGKPNFTMTMPIRFFAKIEKVGLLTTICESPYCSASYGIDASPTTTMAWDAYEKKFYASYDSTLIPISECDRYHTINIEAIDAVDGISNTTQSEFFLSCEPRITANPVEKRFVLSDEGLTAFNTTIWNPREAATFNIEMKNIRPEDVLVLNWLYFDCLGQIGCTANNDFVTLEVSELSSKSAFVQLSAANRAGSYPLSFTATKGSITYKTIAHLLIFAESLYEFNAVYLVALFMIAVIIFVYNKDSCIARRK
jgi:hypothetical protein